MFCKTKASECQLPFKWNGKTFNSCTEEGGDFPWCAIAVDENRNMVGTMYGKCDMTTCTGRQINVGIIFGVSCCMILNMSIGWV